MKTMIFRILLLLLITLFSNPVSGQKLNKQLDVLINSEYPADEPGITVLVARDGEVIYRTARGMANLELEVPLKPEMVFEIGSITKQFTAVSILMLMEQGKLSLDDDITKFIEDYPTHGHTITIHHLLTHISGIKSLTSLEGIWEKAKHDLDPMKIIDIFKNEPMDFAPGEKFLYNNSAYMLLGYIIEKASGMTYPEFLEKNIFEPLGMDNSYYGSKRKTIKNRAYGYQKQDDAFVNPQYLSMTAPYAAGSIMSTVDDLLSWNTALHNHKLVSVENLEKAFTNHTLNNGKSINYGYGWSLSSIKGSPTYEHGGGIFGYLTKVLYLPEEKVFVATLSNRDDRGPDMINAKIAAIAIGKPYPDAKAGIELDPEILRKYTGTYEFEDEAIRYIIFEEGQLYSQRKGSTRFKIFPVSDKKFMYKSSLSSIEFLEKSDGTMEAVFENRMSGTKGKRTSLEIPSKDEIELPVELLKEYAGEYELMPEFSIKFFLEDGKFMTQATGQPSFQVFASSKTRFFLKAVDAEMEFLRDDNGVVYAVMLYQGGQELKGIKKK
jgi:CubicO group peptidase (beta-lactamase class C family)